MEAKAQILLLPFYGLGHLFPCMELCKRFSVHNCKAILIIPSNLSSSIPSSLCLRSLVQVVEIPITLEEFALGITNPLQQFNQKFGNGIESFLSERFKNPKYESRPACVLIDWMMGWSKEIFAKFDVPIVSFFTSNVCSSAVDYAASEAHVGDIKPGETRYLHGLPENMALSYLDVKLQLRGRRSSPPEPNGPDGEPECEKFVPPRPGDKPIWLNDVQGSIALFFNSCDYLEGSFITFLANKLNKPVYGIGPLLPDKYWKSIDSLVHDAESRATKKSNFAENKVIQWLDSKPPESVIYVSFGSENEPTVQEYDELANALGELNRPFIWVIQYGSGSGGSPPGFLGMEPAGLPSKEEDYYPHLLDEKVGNRGLIIKGWAPQLLILSHPSLGGFLSHCGWNSILEALGRGVPILAWPIASDQFYNAKLVINHLRTGQMLLNADDLEGMVKKENIKHAIDMFMDDKEVRKHAKALRCKFKNGLPASSVAALESFLDLIIKKH